MMYNPYVPDWNAIFGPIQQRADTAAQTSQNVVAGNQGRRRGGFLAGLFARQMPGSVSRNFSDSIGITQPMMQQPMQPPPDMKPMEGYRPQPQQQQFAMRQPEYLGNLMGQLLRMRAMGMAQPPMMSQRPGKGRMGY